MSTAGSPNPESLPSRAWSSAPLCPAGIGVPIMLAYVYGVVPISLCRGGGCGVSTANGKGVKIEFDEDDGPITGSVTGGGGQSRTLSLPLVLR